MLAAGDAKGASPTTADEVTVQYRGSLLDGTEFDSSYARGAPATFALGGVIKGWQEALPMMKPGAQWRLFISPELAYRQRAEGPEIPGGWLLIFDVQLMGVSRPRSAMPAPGMPSIPGRPCPSRPCPSRPLRARSSRPGEIAHGRFAVAGQCPVAQRDSGQHVECEARDEARIESVSYWV